MEVMVWAKMMNECRFERSELRSERTGRRLTAPRVMHLVACGVILLTAPGCGRVLTITQEDYINTAMHWGRPKEQRTGEPLEVNIVCVTAGDLKKDGNGLLSPDAGITSKIWYENRPDKSHKDDEGYSGLQLPRGQIFLLTDDKGCYGKRVGGRLRGAVVDNRDKVVMRFNFPGGLHSRKSVIYVFPKFIDADGRVLPVEPAKFYPPGAYTRELSCKIGVDEDREYYGQYIRITTQRKLHGRAKDK